MDDGSTTDGDSAIVLSREELQNIKYKVSIGAVFSPFLIHVLIENSEKYSFSRIVERFNKLSYRGTGDTGDKYAFFAMGEGKLFQGFLWAFCHIFLSGSSFKTLFTSCFH